MPGAQCTRSLACKNKKHTSKSTTGSPENAGIPCAMVLTAYSALSPVTGLVVTVPAQCEALSRVDASVGASGPHGFAVRQLLARLARTSVHRSLPRVRGDREPPLLLGQDGARA